MTSEESSDSHDSKKGSCMGEKRAEKRRAEQSKEEQEEGKHRI